MKRFAARPRIELLLVATFIVVAAIYSVATPIFEASDEASHFPVVKTIADGLGLPVQQPGVKTAWQQEGSQPPLYYLLVSPLARWIDTGDMPDRLRYNPHAHPGDPYVDANKNLVVHSAAESFPWRGTALAVHLIRLVSILMGAATVVATGALAREIVPSRPDLAMGAMAVTAFNPMFLFVTASVNNDNLVILLSTLALLLMMQILNEHRGGRRESQTGSKSWLARRAALASVIGLASLTKVSGLTLLAPAALVLSITHLGQREIRRWIVSGLLLAAGIVLVAGWWYWRNWSLYGEWLGLDTMVKIAGPRSPIPTLLELAGEFEGFKIAYWALFGTVNILTFPVAYIFFDGLSLLAALGLVLSMRHIWRNGLRSDLSPWLALMLYILVMFVGLVRWTSLTPASQGRLLFPAIAAISILIWLGWDTLWNRIVGGLRAARRLRALKWGVPVALLLISVQAPFADILPTYAAPEFLDRAQLPADMQTLDVTFDDRIELLGVVTSRQLDRSGRLSFTAYWQCLVPMRENYSVFVSAIGRDTREVGKLDAYPYRGQLATSDCPGGAIFADPYHVPIDANAQRPTLLRVHIGLTDWSTRKQAELTDGAGNPIPSLVFEAGALPSAATLPAPAVRTDFDFNGTIRLHGYTLSQTSAVPHALELDLHWSASQRPAEDYTLFIHLLNRQSAIVAQWDAQPLNGDYPTSWWQPGEQVLDRRTLPLPADLPAGDYRLAVGLYRAPDGPRLPVRDEKNAPLPDDSVLIDVSFTRP